MTNRRRHNSRKDMPFTPRFHRPCPQHPMPTRHPLDNVPSDPGTSYSWLFVFLGCAALALVVAYPEIFIALVGLGVGAVVIAAMD